MCRCVFDARDGGNAGTMILSISSTRDSFGRYSESGFNNSNSSLLATTNFSWCEIVILRPRTTRSHRNIPYRNGGSGLKTKLIGCEREAGSSWQPSDLANLLGPRLMLSNTDRSREVGIQSAPYKTLACELLLRTRTSHFALSPGDKIYRTWSGE